MCLCGKRYTQAANLCRHQKKCPEYQNYLKEKNDVLNQHNKKRITNKKEQTTTKPKRGRKKKSQPTPQEESDIESSINNTVLKINDELKTKQIYMENMFVELVEQNKQLHEALQTQLADNIEMKKELKTLSDKPNIVNNHYTTNNTTNYTNNQTNNINILNFLNTEYKNAMTIGDFLNSLDVTHDDLIAVRDHGFMDGIGARIVRELKDLPESERPIHFSKRRIKEYFTKAIQGWVKEDGTQKQGLHNLVKGASEKHLSKLMEWRKDNPNEKMSDDEYVNFQRTMFNVYKGIYTNDEETKAMKNKIFKEFECLTLKEVG